LGKRIDEKPYQLPNPEILRALPEEQVRIPSSEHLEGATSAIPMSMPSPPEGTNRRKLVVFAQKKILLSRDLPINTRLRKILEDLIKGGDGEVVGTVGSCDMYICQFRDGEDYIEASQQGKDVGNLSWLYHLIVHNEWTSPFRRLLHYPIPRDGIKGFKDMKITLSNYGGEARIYLENLITAAGATFTKTMKADNTHLITARQNSEKCEAAKDWNIATINHLWIEESYAKCEAQSLTIPKYNHFPLRTNLGEVIGQTFLDESRLRALYYPEVEDNVGRPKANGHKQHDATVNPDSHGVKPSKERRTGSKGVTVMRDSSPSNVITSDEALPQATKSSRPYSTPAKTSHVRSGKENDTPSVGSSVSRNAKAQALSKLHDMAPDIALYEKEKKRSTKDGNAPWGGKRAADQIDRDRPEKRSSSDHESMDEDEEEEPRRQAKKQRTLVPPVTMRVVLTGYKRWVNDKSKEDADRVCLPCRPNSLIYSISG
jgi:hypothetical protein